MATFIFDTETTGIKDPRLVEASLAEAILTDRNLVVLPATVERFSPGVPIEYGAMAVHHITDEDVADSPPATTFRLPADVDYLIGQKVDFDYLVACNCGPQVAPKRICTLALSRSIWPNVDSHSLFALLYFLDKPLARTLVERSHSAGVDVLACATVLEHVLRMLPAVQTWEDLWAASEVARVPTVLPFGKHKGMVIKDVPKDYKAWLLKQSDVDPYLRQALAS